MSQMALNLQESQDETFTNKLALIIIVINITRWIHAFSWITYYLLKQEFVGSSNLTNNQEAPLTVDCKRHQENQGQGGSSITQKSVSLKICFSRDLVQQL